MIKQSLWQRLLLLAILGYEGLGALAGGIMLMLQPDGRLMDMPVSMMHGTFKDFFIPGILLFALGILGIVAFRAVWRRSDNDWWMAFLSLGGFYIWFTVEIIVLRELHWLHLMWGYPVLAGLLVAFPLALLRKGAGCERLFLSFGLLSSAWYVLINVLVPAGYDGYNMATLTVSELSALGAPTRWLWVVSVTPYALLFAAFGWGVRTMAGSQRRYLALGTMIILYSAFNFYWPPMHMRGTTPSLTDTLHIAWASVTVLLMMILMVMGSTVGGKKFRLYTWISLALLILFGILTSTEAPNIPVNGPTPMIGVWERINIGMFMLWVAVLSNVLLKKSVRI